MFSFTAFLAFRLINVLLLQTYFDPDEFWQGEYTVRLFYLLR